MIMHSKGIKIILSSLFVLGTLFSIPVDDASAHSKTVEAGDRYGYVWDLQHRLQQLGYLKEDMDGIFGVDTEQAVIHFQQDFGLKVDGIAGHLTWNQLYQQTFSVNEIQMMAQMVHGEARGEPFKGKVAVAAVIINRVQSNDFPDTVKGVLFENRAFTAVADGQYYMSPERGAYRAVYNAIQGWDPTESAVFYFNPNTATSDWIWSQTQTTKIGKHIFAK
ncbi:spore cortex-lytic enzyme [Alkalihalobacillus sp. AL-G]|uniref:spore cortex-lytic enzyme n=1 Tax=Alkalihalobacillus sp. AL-G TaxID=2926399 RepID=UPI002729C871|nr:spore cortex-lytic enzyme [Alkalihalobacillus sp. AL-G]WLD91544.1 spore cortex-lytic enzyme [Alkalihalobacillus sp. AL-G]